MCPEDPAHKFFDKKMTDKERAIFEGGIGLAAIYHQFIGIPVTGDRGSLENLEEAIRKATLLQPFKKEVKVKLNVAVESSKDGEYSYRSLEGKDFDVTIVTQYGNFSATCRMKYIAELKYVLMYVEKIDEII